MIDKWLPSNFITAAPVAENLQLLVTSAQRYGIRSSKRRRGAMPGVMACPSFLKSLFSLG